MVRTYLSNVSFRNSANPIVDSENIKTKWSMYVNGEETSSWGGGLDFSNPSFLGNLSPNTSMIITTPNTFIRSTNPIVSDTNQFTIATRYRIPESAIYDLITDLPILPLIKWDDGMLNVMDYTDTDKICIGISHDWLTHKGPIHYDSLGYGNPIQLVWQIDHHSILLYINGIKIIDDYISNEINTLTNLSIGNCGDYTTEIQIDELAITDSIEPPTSFTLKPYHSLYPEVDDVDVVKRRRVNTVSDQDRLNLDLDITRHSDYTPPKSYQVDRIRRYKFD